ncbi:MAG: EF-hand domain-containing protein [Candidatus Riflemargulisbacteria bacterium]
MSSSRNNLAAQMWSQLIKNDQDTDSQLNKAEMQAALSNMPLPPSNATSFEDIFTAIDTNKDGAVSKDEFSSFVKSHRPPETPSNGGISFSDMQEKLWQSLLTQADANGDSTVSQTEFNSLGSEATSSSISAKDKADVFAQIDTDKNGQITKGEFNSYLEANKPSDPPPPKPSNDKVNSSSSNVSLAEIQDELWKALMQTDEVKKDENKNISSYLIEQLKSYASTTSGQSTEASASISADFSA